jgi:hypothetical protein
MTNDQKLKELLEEYIKARKTWCAEEVDDGEEMWSEMPPLIEHTVSVLEEVLNLPPSSLKINVAFYGTEAKFVDVTDILQKNTFVNKLKFLVDNKYLGGDPVPGAPKTLTVTYTYQRETNTVSTAEHQYLIIDKS